MVIGALFAAAAVTVAIVRRRTERLRPVTNAAVGTAAAALVFDMQRGLGVSAGGAVLALAAGAIAVLIMTLFRSV